jgi:hypothetical protein
MREEGKIKKLHNKELRNTNSLLEVTRLIKQRRLGWKGHRSNKCIYGNEKCLWNFGRKIESYHFGDLGMYKEGDIKMDLK